MRGDETSTQKRPELLGDARGAHAVHQGPAVTALFVAAVLAFGTQPLLQSLGRDTWIRLSAHAEIKAGGGRQTKVEVKSHVAQVRLKSGLSQAQFAAALGVSKRTLEQWEQGRREPRGAARQLLKIAERYPGVLIEVAA